jgi:hypothetical protein
MADVAKALKDKEGQNSSSSKEVPGGVGAGVEKI